SLLDPLRNLLFFSTAPPPTEIYTLSLHDALPIFRRRSARHAAAPRPAGAPPRRRIQGRHEAGNGPGRDDGRPRPRPADRLGQELDRKSTRLNSSHVEISYAVFCLKKKTENTQ